MIKTGDTLNDAAFFAKDGGLCEECGRRPDFVTVAYSPAHLCHIAMVRCHGEAERYELIIEKPLRFFAKRVDEAYERIAKLGIAPIDAWRFAKKRGGRIIDTLLWLETMPLEAIHLARNDVDPEALARIEFLVRNE